MVYRGRVPRGSCKEMREKQEGHGKELSKDGILGLHWDLKAFYSKNNIKELSYLETGGWILVTLYSPVSGP